MGEGGRRWGGPEREPAEEAVAGATSRASITAILDSLEDEIPGLEGGLLGQAGGSALATVPNALVRSVLLFT